MRLTILGEERECRKLSAADRRAWSQYVHYEVLRTFYSDLYSRVDFLPEALQVVVFQNETPPDRVDPSSPDYYRVASTPAAVRYLLGLVATDWTVEVTDKNAPEILLALRPVLFPPAPGPTLDTPERQKAAAEIFTKLENENNAS
jgi:hypothetical protein